MWLNIYAISSKIKWNDFRDLKIKWNLNKRVLELWTYLVKQQSTHLPASEQTIFLCAQVHEI